MSIRTALAGLGLISGLCVLWASHSVPGALLAVAVVLLVGEHQRASSLERKAPEPAVYWLTGVSGSGKSTLGAALASELRFRGHNVQVLDGDTLRKHMGVTSFEPSDIRINTIRVGYIASLLEANGVTVVATFIMPFSDAREEAHAQCVNPVEIFVSARTETVVGRDTKGLYKGYSEGTIRNIHGFDAQYDKPTHPDAIVETDSCTPEESMCEMVAQLESKNLI